MMKTLIRAAGALKGWKTILLSVAMTVAGVLQSTDTATLVEPGGIGPAMLVSGVLVGVLRALTDTPIGRK